MTYLSWVVFDFILLLISAGLFFSQARLLSYIESKNKIPLLPFSAWIILVMVLVLFALLALLTTALILLMPIILVWSS